LTFFIMCTFYILYFFLLNVLFVKIRWSYFCI